MACREGAKTVGLVLKGTTKSISFHFGFHEWACLFPVDAELLEDLCLLGIGHGGFTHLDDRSIVKRQGGGDQAVSLNYTGY
jgi:hypothetical protein